MEQVIAALLGGILGLLAATFGAYYTNKYIEQRRRYISTKREQLQYVYSPLEVLVRINAQEFNRYFEDNTTKDDREFIERRIWYPNNTEIRRIIMENSHLLTEVPEALLALLAHINVWLSEYELVYVKETKPSPVFAGPKGFKYPHEVNDYIYSKAKKLWEELNK